jgi:Toprim domain-containing protein
MPRLRQNDPLMAFRQHGFRESHKSADDTHAIGDCPLCGKQDHFYINVESKMWDCKSCGHDGGFQTFLADIAAVSREGPELDSRLETLSRERGLGLDILRQYDVGYNRLSGEYLIPVYYQDAGETKVWDLRRAIRHVEKDGTVLYQMMGTAGCQLGILGWEQGPAYQRLWLCEGEWDAMACNELLQRLGIESDLALGLPGAGVLKAQWIPLFQKHDVIAAYDADEAGRKGAQRAFNLLRNRVSALQFVHWGEGVPEGYDIRDLCRDKGTAAFDHLLASLHPQPEGCEVPDVSAEGPTRFGGSGVEASEVYQVYTKWLHMPDTTILDVVYGTVIANRRQGDPIWLHLVAPPGATKTEVLVSLTGSPDVVYRNTLSAKGLVSGQIAAGGADPSLLPRLHERILVIEDFTTIMSIQSVFRDEIFGILRSAYNGKFERDYGNGRYVNIDCHFGIITGVTPAIEHNAEMMAALGERFLNYAPPIPTDIKGRRPFLLKSQQNSGHEVEMREELKAIAHAALNHSFDTAPDVPTPVAEQILDLAQWTSMMRGVVRRERYSVQKDITHEPYAELGTRLVKQFTKLADGIARFRRVGTVGDREFKAIRAIAFGSVASERRRLVKTMWLDTERAWTTHELSEATGLPRSPLVERAVETLIMLGIIRKGKGIQGMRSTYTYRFQDDFAELTERSGIFTN